MSAEIVKTLRWVERHLHQEGYDAYLDVGRAADMLEGRGARLSELEAQVAALTETVKNLSGMLRRADYLQKLTADSQDAAIKRAQYAESQLAQARDGALEEAARYFDDKCLGWDRESWITREYRATANIIRAMKSPQTALSKETP